ncbi:ISKra4 family transposase [Nocardiopsis sp. NPDC049922]|uniref:ISKra4 family transposase n=1 Tax=Nocardiopsis sp. NPDC049922 TaxID=3155157 RepID=UPI0033DDBCBD
MDQDAVYQLRVVLSGISPLIWRRLLVPDSATIADLHEILQTAFGWSDGYLHRFTIHGVEYGLGRLGAVGFSHDAHQVRLADFAFRPGERFTYTYTYNLFAFWRHDIRVEKLLPRTRGRILPVCTGGARQAPPEECRDAEAFLALRRDLPQVVIAARLAEFLTEVMDAPDDQAARALLADRREEMDTLVRYAGLDDFDRGALNRALAALQRDMVAAQARTAVETARTCTTCGKRRGAKDSHQIVLRTLFGTLHLDSPRYLACRCGADQAATVSPLTVLLPERTTPELLFWEAKYAALLGETFPLGRELQAAAVRQHVEQTATRLEEELGEEHTSFIDTCPRDWEDLPRPGLPLVVTLDGGYVHSSNQTSRRDGWFEVVTGRSTPTGGGDAKTFAFVQTYDHKPKRRLYEVLKAQGMADNQQVVFLTDGGEDIRDLPAFLNPQAEYYLDWFHVTMRITVLRQMTRSLPPPGDVDEEVFTIDPVRVDADLERIKHFLWHGNTYRALDLIEDLVEDSETVCAEEATDKQRAFLTRISEFCGYIASNRGQIPNYGERHRCGEAVSSASAESAVNQVISRRVVKKQQMRWSPRGAHLLLQVRTRVLNGDLADDFARWYPGFAPPEQDVGLAA